MITRTVISSSVNASRQRTAKLAPAALLAFSLLLGGCDDADEAKPASPMHSELPDFAAISDVQQKKQSFFNFLLPQIHQANQAVERERQQFLQWQQDDQANGDNPEYVALLKKYRVKSDDLTEQHQQLAMRLLPIPASLVLAQAANESAWGTSRFAREGNNLFGQWCFSKGCGLVPQSRNAGANHEVASFDSTAESVASYIRNLNRHPSYEMLRQLRQQQLSQQGFATGETLAQGLLRYSERGEAYVEEIQAMIRHNKLQQYDAPPANSAGQ